MLSARKQVKIISIGEIVTPDVMKTIRAFAAMIANKNISANPHEIGKSIGQVLQQNMKLINDFKIGVLNESDFTQQMIAALKNATGIELTVYEFDQAWNAMNPKLEQFETLLKQVLEFNHSSNQKVVFISFTNPKDIKHLINELERSSISYQIDDDQLIEIGGIQLHTTYNTKKNKAELIETIIKKLTDQLTTQSTFVKSISNILNVQQVAPQELVDIKYIRSVSSLDDPILKEDLDKTNHEVEMKAARFFVDTILWMKNENTLLEVLQNTQQVSKQISVTNL